MFFTKFNQYGGEKKEQVISKNLNVMKIFFS